MSQCHCSLIYDAEHPLPQNHHTPGHPEECPFARQMRAKGRVLEADRSALRERLAELEKLNA